MVDVFFIFLPFFALVTLGWVAVRLGLFPSNGLAHLNTFVLFFGLPAMVFRLAAQGALTHPGLLGWLVAYAAGGTLVLALSILVYSRIGLLRRDAGMLALATTFPNTGFLGLPLLTTWQGPTAAGPIMSTLVVDVLLISTLALLWAHSSTADSGNGQRLPIWKRLHTRLKGPLRNPLLWSMLAGMVSSKMAMALPAPVDKALYLLSLAASPIALFVLGGMMARHRGTDIITKHGERSLPTPALLTGLVLKLGIHPTLVWMAGLALRKAGLDVPPTGLVTLSLAAALPSASNVLMLAQHQGAQHSWIARIIFWTTLLSMPTMMMVNGWLSNFQLLDHAGVLHVF